MTEFQRHSYQAETEVGANLNVLALSSIEQWYELGLTDEQLDGACHTVSDMVRVYVTGHNGEMLLKDSGQIKRQFLSGDSVMLVDHRGHGISVIGHGTNYINFESGEDKLLGMQVTEIGTVIVDEKYRGRGFGKLGVKHLAEMALNGYGNVLRLATVKQAVTARVFKDAGIIPVSFYTYPYLSYLTCTCENSSERCGFASCGHRRPAESSGEEHFAEALSPLKHLGKIPCTLVLSDLELAERFEATCADLHQNFGGTPLVPGRINPDTFRDAEYFFSKVREFS